MHHQIRFIEKYKERKFEKRALRCAGAIYG